jgi:hemerythrin-like domain-containing protein
MQARGPLMVEHRVIEQVIQGVNVHLSRIEPEGGADPSYIAAVIDFLRTYADRTHHGKEEDILFARLHRKDLSPEDERVLGELEEEHVRARETVAALEEATRRYRDGDRSALTGVTEGLRALVELYPQHIVKEDRVFFPAAQGYFSPEEERELLAEFRSFDASMIHEKYRAVAGGLAGGRLDEGAGGAPQEKGRAA